MKITNVDNLIARYQAGEPVTKLAREIGVHHTSLRTRFIKSGVRLRGNKEAGTLSMIDVPGLDSILARYEAGETEQALANELGISRAALRSRIVSAGITPRTISDTMYSRWSRASGADRCCMLTPAHAASRGRTVSNTEAINQAVGREKAKTVRSELELSLGEMLAGRHLKPSFQRAVGKYNIDIALDEPSIAVEVFGGGWHATGRHRARFFDRTKYLLDLGWHVVIVWVDKRRYPLGIECANYIASFRKMLRGKPSMRSQYRVILGNGEFAPIRKSCFNTPADIVRLGCD